MITQKQAAVIVNSVFASIAAAVAAGDMVSIPGFGTSKPHAARTCRSHRTKEAVEVPASTVSSFKAGKAFKEKVNGSLEIQTMALSSRAVSFETALLGYDVMDINLLRLTA